MCRKIFTLELSDLDPEAWSFLSLREKKETNCLRDLRKLSLYALMQRILRGS